MSICKLIKNLTISVLLTTSICFATDADEEKDRDSLGGGLPLMDFGRLELPTTSIASGLSVDSVVKSYRSEIVRQEELDELHQGLFRACKSSDVESVKRLIGEGVNISIYDPRSGMTPLHQVCAIFEWENSKVENYIEIASLLLDQETINVNALDRGMDTPVHYLCSWEMRNPIVPATQDVRGGAIRLLEMLIGKGADINLPNSISRMTPLAYACTYAPIETVRTLIKANPEVLTGIKSGLPWLLLYMKDNIERGAELVRLGLEIRDDHGGFSLLDSLPVEQKETLERLYKEHHHLG